MSDNVRFTITAEGAQARAQIRALEAQLRSLQPLLAAINAEEARRGGIVTASNRAVRETADAIAANIAALRASVSVANQATEATKKLSQAEKDRLYDLQRQIDVSSQISNRRDQETRSIQAQQAATQRLQATQALANREHDLQRRLQIAALSDPFGGRRGEVSGFFNSAQTIAAQRNFAGVLAKLKADAEREGEAAGQGFWSRFFTPRTMVTFGDELARGQRGQMAASIGAAFKRADMTPGPAVGIGLGLAGVGVAAIGVEHMARSMGDLAEKTAAAAQSAGLSVKNYASLQGALILTGAKANDADAALRAFGSNIEKAMANPASRSAKALGAIPGAFDAIKSKGNDVVGQLAAFIEKFNQMDTTGTNAAAVLEAIFNRSDATISRLIDKGPDGFRRLVEAAGPFADATARNNQKLIEMGERLNKVSLEWMTVKLNASDAINFMSGGVLNLIETIKALGGAIAAISGSFMRMSADIDRGISSLLNKMSFGLISATPPGDKPGGIYNRRGFDVNVPPTELPEVTVSANKPKISPFDIPKGSGAEARKDWNAYVQEQKNLIQEARGDWDKINQIIADWRAKAAQHFAANSADYRKAMAEIDKATIHANQQRIDDAVSTAGTLRRLNEDVLRGFEAEMQSLVKKRDISPQQAFGFDIQENNRMAAAEKEIIDKLMLESTALKDAASQHKLYIAAWELGIKTKTRDLELTEKIDAANQKVRDAWATPIKQALDSIGSGFESALSGLLDRSKNMRQTWLDIEKSVTKSTISLAGSLLSKGVAAAAGAKGGEGIGEYLGQQLIAAIGLGSPTQTALLTDIASTLHAILATSGTSSGASGISAAGSAGGLFGGLKSLFGGLFGGGGAAAGGIGADAAWLEWAPTIALSRGGIVPSAARGMIVPSFAYGGISGGQLSILHPREMVLPSNLSQGMQGLIANQGQGGSPGLNDFHFHLHGIANDGPAVERMIRGNRGVLVNMVKDALRSNTITPRSF